MLGNVNKGQTLEENQYLSEIQPNYLKAVQGNSVQGIGEF